MELKQIYCKRCGKIVVELFRKSEKCNICGSDFFPHPYLFDDWTKMSEEDRENWIAQNIIHDDKTAYYTKQRILYEQKSLKELEQIAKGAQPKPANIPHCPICGSADLKKLSTVGKAAKIGIFGIFGMGDVGKTYKCNNCGSKF